MTCSRKLWIISAAFIIAVCRSQQPHETEACAQATTFLTCNSDYITAASNISPGDREAVCKVRAAHSLCLEKLVCECQYPSTSRILLQVYRELMKNIYADQREGCSQYDIGYMGGSRSGISCAGTGQPMPARYEENSAGETFIQEMTANCSKMLDCFVKRDIGLQEGLYMKNLRLYCESYQTFLTCLETTACDCGLNQEKAVTVVDLFEKEEYTGQCFNVTDTSTVLPEFTCNGVCSLSDPSIVCEQGLQQTLALGVDEEGLCRAWRDYAVCYEQLVCNCSLYQKSEIYTALTIARYQFEIRSQCTRYAGLVFPVTDQGFICPQDTSLTNDQKMLTLNTAQADVVRTQESLCPGISLCYDQYDVTASEALFKKNLSALCKSLSDQIVCLERVACDCNSADTRFALESQNKRLEMSTICSDDVMSSPPIADCLLCGQADPLGVCSNVLTQPPAPDTDQLTGLCSNFFQYGACLREIGCRCNLASNGSDPNALRLYQLLGNNARDYDLGTCSVVTGAMDIGPVQCPNDSTDEMVKKLVVSWKRDEGKVSRVQLCPALETCYAVEDTVLSEAYYVNDFRRVCIGQLNAIKCEERALCDCSLADDETIAQYLSNQKTVHSQQCSRFAPMRRSDLCDKEENCTESRERDVCSDELTGTSDLQQTCQEYARYLSCAQENACSCGLVTDGSHPVSARVHRNVGRILYLLFRNQCTVQFPEMLLNPGIECYDPVTALPVQKSDIVIDYVNDPSVQQWSDSCPAVITCALQYDRTATPALIIKNYASFCNASHVLMRCVKRAFCQCETGTTAEVQQYLDSIMAMHGNCSEVIPIGNPDCKDLEKEVLDVEKGTQARGSNVDNSSVVSNQDGGMQQGTSGTDFPSNTESLFVHKSPQMTTYSDSVFITTTPISKENSEIENNMNIMSTTNRFGLNDGVSTTKYEHIEENVKISDPKINNPKSDTNFHINKDSTDTRQNSVTTIKPTDLEGIAPKADRAIESNKDLNTDLDGGDTEKLSQDYIDPDIEPRSENDGIMQPSIDVSDITFGGITDTQPDLDENNIKSTNIAGLKPEVDSYIESDNNQDKEIEQKRGIVQHNDNVMVETRLETESNDTIGKKQTNINSIQPTSVMGLTTVANSNIHKESIVDSSGDLDANTITGNTDRSYVETDSLVSSNTHGHSLTTGPDKNMGDDTSKDSGSGTMTDTNGQPTGSRNGTFSGDDNSSLSIQGSRSSIIQTYILSVTVWILITY